MMTTEPKKAKPTISPGTSIQSILQHQIEQLQKNSNVERPSKYVAQVVKTLHTPTANSGYMPAFDPFWSTTDDTVRFTNYGFITKTVKSRKTAIVSCSPPFQNVLTTKFANFNNSFLLRVPYTQDALLGKLLEVGNEIEVTFGGRSTLTNPKMVKKAAPDSSAAPLPANKKKTIFNVDKKENCGEPKWPGSPRKGADGKCVCTGGYKWDSAKGNCCKE
jgi:hypothetical protein